VLSEKLISLSSSSTQEPRFCQIGGKDVIGVFPCSHKQFVGRLWLEKCVSAAFCAAHKCVSATNKIFVTRFVAQIRQTTGEVIVDFVARFWREIQIEQQNSV